MGEEEEQGEEQVEEQGEEPGEGRLQKDGSLSVAVTNSLPVHLGPCRQWFMLKC